MSAPSGVGNLPEPDPWHLPCAYWFWHRIPTSTEIRDQLRQMREAGIMSFQVQARLSMPLEDYLGADYLAAYRRAVDEAAAHGMVVGIYDDYNWQSGHAAGRAVADHPEFAEAHLFWSTGEVPADGGPVRLEVSGITSSSADLGEAGMRWHYRGSVPRWADWAVFLAAVAAEGEDGGVLDVTGSCRLTGTDDGCTIEVDVPSGVTGTVTVFVSGRCASSRLVNHMDPAAVRRFVEVGYQPIADVLGGHVGTTVQYLFFDQPHPNFFSWAQHSGQLGHAMPVSGPFLEHLRDRWGAELGPMLLHLLHGSSSAARAARCDFYEDYGTWARESFLGTARAWTSAHGLALSGHEVLPHVGGWTLDAAFRTWDLRVNFGLDFFAIDAYRDLTACDAQDARPQLAPKLADAVARANGRRGAMLEQYYADAVAGTGSYTGHWGLTPDEFRRQTIRHHLAGMRQQILHGFYLTDGHDDDVTMFANPRFDFPPGFNFEPWFGRYSADIALETGRLSHFLDDLEQDRRIALLYPTRTVWADTQQGPHARDFGRWAEILTAANIPFDIVDEQMLGTGLPSYDAVVLPAVTILASRESVERIGDLLARGGEVLVSGRTPVAYQHGPQTAAEDWAALEARGADRITRYEEAPAAADALARFRGPAPAAGTSAIAVVAGVGPDGRRRLAAFNDGTTPAELALHPEDGEVLVVRDAASGEVRSVVRADSDQRMQPAELLLIEQVDDAPHDAAGEDVGPATCQALADGWTVRVADTDDDLVLRDVDPARGLEEQGLPAFSGVVTYSRTVVLDAPGRLLLDLPAVVGGAEVFLNGRCVGRRGWAPYVYRIAASDTVAGENHLQIEVAGTAANRYYAGTGMRDRPDPCGIIGTPRLHVLT